MKKFKSGYQGAREKKSKPSSGLLSDYDLQKYIRFMAIPLVVILLVAVIVFADNKKGSGETAETIKEPAVSFGGSEDGIDLSDDTQYHQDFSEYELKVNDVPEIDILMEDYYMAKQQGDAEAVAHLFRITDEQEIQDWRAKAQIYQELVESYDKITCYYKPGIEQDSYLVYVYSEMKFKEADTPGPSLIWVYVKRGEDGEYQLCDPEQLTEEEKAYVEKVKTSEDVQMLNKQAEDLLREALMSDQNLAYYYNQLRVGSTVFEPESGTVSEENTQDASDEAQAAESEDPQQPQSAETESSIPEQGQQETAAE